MFLVRFCAALLEQDGTTFNLLHRPWSSERRNAWRYRQI